MVPAAPMAVVPYRSVHTTGKAKPGGWNQGLRRPEYQLLWGFVSTEPTTAQAAVASAASLNYWTHADSLAMTHLMSLNARIGAVAGSVDRASDELAQDEG